MVYSLILFREINIKHLQCFFMLYLLGEVVQLKRCFSQWSRWSACPSVLSVCPSLPLLERQSNLTNHHKIHVTCVKWSWKRVCWIWAPYTKFLYYTHTHARAQAVAISGPDPASIRDARFFLNEIHVIYPTNHKLSWQIANCHGDPYIRVWVSWTGALGKS